MLNLKILTFKYHLLPTPHFDFYFLNQTLTAFWYLKIIFEIHKQQKKAIWIA